MTKTGVLAHPREGEIVLNDVYRQLAAHYSAAVLPGRVRHPKDKARVENTVGHIATTVIAALRERTVTGLVELRVSDTALEVWARDERLASHPLSPATAVNQYQTRQADLPDGRAWAEWDPDRVRARARRIGPDTATVVDRIFETATVAEAGVNPALAVLRLSRRYSPAGLGAAAQIALAAGIRSPRYAHLQPILATGQDKTERDRAWSGDRLDEQTGFVRGADYYAGGQK